ncbi:hypothetical protein V6N11_020873 [Hibiscus sabdariffa]|uniref:Terpene synthase metal-binding domain-containing protein n=1 Tax=Hibiscus sabdariffa TaxID=183260 RepID=A0ABR2Q9S0_9ROSI
MSSPKRPSSTQGSMSDQQNRPLANFHPNVWGDIFLNPSITNIDAATQLQHQELKKKNWWNVILDVGNVLWDVDFMDQLPNYMKLFYKSLLDLYREVEEAMTEQGQSYRVQYSINKLKELSESYFVKVKWYRDNYVPTMEEYMRVGIIIGGTIGLNVTSLVGMNDALTPEIFNSASCNPKIMERGHCTSAIECYMREHEVSEEEACNVLKKQVDDTWKVINHEMIFSETSKVVLMAVFT